MPEKPKEAVNHPDHYGGDKPYEAIKVIHAALGPEACVHFCQGNALKYILRAGKKDPTKASEDFKKAAWYSEYAAGILSGQIPQP